MVSSTTRVVWWAAAACIVTWIIAVSLPRDFAVGNFVDDAHYAVLAKALRERGTYRAIHLPDQPPETKYPPGYPALLAGVWSPDLSASDNLNRLRWVNLFLVGPVAAVLVVFATTGLGVSAPVATALAVGGLLNPATATLWVVPLSEPFFLLLVTLGLALSREKRYTAILVLLGAVYVRTIAIVFLVGAIAVRPPGHSVTRLRKEIGVAVLGLVPWILWQAATARFTPDVLLGLYGPYTRWFLDGLRIDPLAILFWSPLLNGVDAMVQLGHVLMRAQWMSNAVSFWVGGLVLVALLAARRVHAGFTLGLALYLGVTIAWPYAPGRFIGGITPLLVLGVAAALKRRAVLLAVVTVGFGIVSIARHDAVFYHRIRSRISENAIALATRHSNPAQTLATTNPPLHYLRLGMHTVPIQRLRSYLDHDPQRALAAWGDGRDLWDLIEHYHPDLALVEGRGREGPYAVADLLEQCPGILTPIDSSGGASVYAVRVQDCEAVRR